MITVVEVTLAMPKEANAANVRRAVVGELYSICRGLPNVEKGHVGMGQAPFRLASIALGRRWMAKIVVLDDECLKRIMEEANQGHNKIAAARIGQITTCEVLQERGAMIQWPVTLAHTTPLAFRRHTNNGASVDVRIPDGRLLARSVRMTWQMLAPNEYVDDSALCVTEMHGQCKTLNIGSGSELIAVCGFTGTAKYECVDKTQESKLGALMLMACWVGVGRRATWGAGRVEPRGGLAEIDSNVFRPGLDY